MQQQLKFNPKYPSTSRASLEPLSLKAVRDYVHEHDVLPKLRVLSKKLKLKMGTLSCYICLLRKNGYVIEARHGRRGGFAVSKRAKRDKIILTTPTTNNKKKKEKEMKKVAGVGQSPFVSKKRTEEQRLKKLKETALSYKGVDVVHLKSGKIIDGQRFALQWPHGVRNPQRMDECLDNLHNRLDIMEAVEDDTEILKNVIHKMELVDSQLIQRTEHTENRVKEFSNRLLTLCENERFKHRARVADCIIKATISASLLGLFLLELLDQ